MITPEMQELLKKYNLGLMLYKDRKFKEAKQSFQEALNIVPGDGPSKLYIDRCDAFIKEPPPADWDGVFIMKTK